MLPEEQFEEAIARLAADLESARERLYALAVEALAVRHPRQLARAELNLMTGQLVLASYLIADQKYLDATRSNRFVTLLWSEVLGTRMAQGADQARVLGKAQGSFARLHLFFTLLAADITGRQDAARGLLLLSRFGSMFVAETYRSAARALGDPDAPAEPLDLAAAWRGGGPLDAGFVDELKKELVRRKAL